MVVVVKVYMTMVMVMAMVMMMIQTFQKDLASNKVLDRRYSVQWPKKDGACDIGDDIDNGGGCYDNDNDDDDNYNDGSGDGVLLPQQKGHEWHCLYCNTILQIQMKF